MALTQPTTLADWAPQGSVSLFTRILSHLRSAWINLFHDNPVAWKLGLRGRANAFEDMEGMHTRSTDGKSTPSQLTRIEMLRSVLPHRRALAPSRRRTSRTRIA